MVGFNLIVKSPLFVLLLDTYYLIL